MSGSWELRQRNSMVLGILHTDLTSVAWALGLRNLQIPGTIMPVAGMPYDMARNTVAQHVLVSGATWCGFLDSDVIPPADAYLRLIAHNQPLMSGVYHRRSPPEGIAVMMKPLGQWVVNYPSNSVIEVDVVGAGCRVIHRSVLERMQMSPKRPGKRWFDWRVDMKGILPQEECLSEDFAFDRRCALEYGYKILVDTSIQCRHVGLAEATCFQFRPCDTTPNT